MKSKNELIKQLNEIAKEYGFDDPEKGIRMRQIIEEFDNSTDDVGIKIQAKVTVRKFDGEIAEGKEPKETIITTTNI